MVGEKKKRPFRPLTIHEKKNGWTQEQVGRYLEESNRRAAGKIFAKKGDPYQMIPAKDHDPHSW